MQLRFSVKLRQRSRHRNRTAPHKTLWHWRRSRPADRPRGRRARLGSGCAPTARSGRPPCCPARARTPRPGSARAPGSRRLWWASESGSVRPRWKTPVYEHKPEVKQLSTADPETQAIPELCTKLQHQNCSCERILVWDCSSHGSPEAMTHSPCSWGSRGRWRRRRGRTRTAASCRAASPGRPHRPGRGTARCSRSLKKFQKQRRECVGVREAGFLQSWPLSFSVESISHVLRMHRFCEKFFQRNEFPCT